MPTTRRRRIIRRAVMSLAVVVLLGHVVTWFFTREPPEFQRSRALRLRMTKAEVEAVMGCGENIFSRYGSGLVFGESELRYARFWYKIREATGDRLSGLDLADRTVSVRFDKSGHVDQIRRGRQFEGAPELQPAQ